MSNLSEAKPSSASRIVIQPSVLGGRPFIRDTRLSVEFLQGLIATGWSSSRILDVYQYLHAEDLQALAGSAGGESRRN